MNKKKIPLNLSALIHADNFKYMQEQVVFTIADRVATAFGLSGEDHILQYVLDVEDDLNDAEILITRITQALLDQQRRQMAQMVFCQIQQLQAAYDRKGVRV